jgi:NADH-quinone oxidoreductase subunit G
MNAHQQVSEPKPPEDPDSPLTYTMEGFHGIPPSPLIPFFWSPGWNSEQSINKYQIEIGGALHDSATGLKLIKAAESLTFSKFEEIPDAFEAKDNGLLMIPQNLIFGSEELSSMALAVQQRIPDPFVVISRSDAEKYGIEEGQNLLLTAGDTKLAGKAIIKERFPKGIAGIPHNLPEFTGLKTPGWATITGESQ